MQKLLKIENVLAAVLVILFFLPWFSVSMFGFTMSQNGLEVAFGDLGGIFAILKYFLVLIPIGAILLIVQSVLGKEFVKNLGMLLAYISAGLPVLYVINMFLGSEGVSQLGMSPLSFVGFGAWLTLAVGVLFILIKFNVLKIQLPGDKA